MSGSGTIANLKILLTGDDKDASKKLKNTQSNVASLGKSVAGAGAALGGPMIAGIAGVAVGAIAAVASVHALNEQIEQVSNIVDASNRLGIGTESLIAFGYAASQAGGSQEEMNQGLSTMSVNVSKAAMGMGKAQKAIKALGLDAKELNALSPEEKMMKIAEALNNVQNQGDKVAFATAIFGDAKFLNYLEGGAEGLQAMADRAKYLGLTLTDDAASSIEQTGDAVADIGNAFTGFARQALAVLAPAIEAGANAITDFIVYIREWLLEGDFDLQEYVNTTAAYLENAGAVWEAFKANAVLYVVSMYEELKHIFLDVLPTVFIEFANGLNGTLTEIGHNLGEFANAAWQALTNWDSSLLNDAIYDKVGGAFDSALDNVAKALPRTMTKFEQDLADEAGAAMAKLDQGVAKSREARASKEVKGKPKWEAGNGIAGMDKEAKGNSQFGLAEKGSAEAYKVIASVLNKDEKLEELTEEIKDDSDEIAQATTKIADWTDSVQVA